VWTPPISGTWVLVAAARITGGTVVAVESARIGVTSPPF
jgi:hypothetical protein